MVEAALARGWSNQRIADALGISPASLKRYFRAALKQRDVMRDKLEMAANAALIRAAIEGGNMTAMKQLRELLDRDGLTRQKRKLEEQQREADAAGLGMGKKEAQQRAAEESLLSDGWGNLLDPARMN
jgi:DNA-binding NarL/FixJ family response regulator